MTKRAALYLRQSKANDEGIERQLARTTALATARGWAVAGTFEDNDVSADKPRGPETAWGRLLATSDDFDVVIAVDLDRIARSTRDLNTLIDHGLALVTVDGEIDLASADGEFRGTMLAAIARFEVRRKGERQRRANEQRAAKGRIPKGQRLYGYGTTGDVVAEEAAQVKALFEGFDRGETLRGLSRNLAPVPWRILMPPSTIRGILTNPRYCGRRVYKGEHVATGDWEPLVGEALFDRVNRRLADPARQMNRTGSTARRSLGTSLFRCGECADHPTLRTAGSGGRYWCRFCGLVRRMAPVDDFVLALLWGRLTMPDAREALSPHPDLEPLRERASGLRERRKAVTGLVAKGLMEEAEAEAALIDVKTELAELEAHLARAEGPVAMLTEEEVEGGLDKLSLDRKRALIDRFLTVDLLRARRGSRVFDPTTVVTDWRATRDVPSRVTLL